MNKLLQLLLPFLFLQPASAQNWSVINSTEKFNYRLDNDSVVTSTVWIDSVQLTGTDSVYFLNRIIRDTCATIAGGPNFCDTCYGLKNQPQFLQRTVTVSQAGIYNLRDTGNIVIQSLAALNDSWVFDSTLNISATVIATGVDSVFGSADSTKTILLTSGDTVILSQNSGLLKYPNGYGMNSYFRLAGIEGRNAGEQVPGFFEIFNFDIGDMFEYYFRGGNDDCAFYEIRKYEIVSKQVWADSVSYSVSGIYNRTEWPPWWWSGCSSVFYSGLYSSTQTYVDSAGHYSNTYHRQPIEDFHDADVTLQQDSGSVRTWTYLDSNQVYSKSFGIGNGFAAFGYEAYYRYFRIGSGDTLNPISGSYNYSITFQAGLGITDRVHYVFFESSDRYHVTAYRKGNDTVGVFTEDSVILLGVNQPLIQKDIQVYPNPTSGKVKLLNAGFKIESVQVYNMLGELMKSVFISSGNPGEEIDVSGLPGGVYIIQVGNREKWLRAKVVKE